MKIISSRCYPVVDIQTLGEILARETLLRIDEGSFVLYLAWLGDTEREERALFLNGRDALIWLNETPDGDGFYWDLAERNQ